MDYSLKKLIVLLLVRIIFVVSFQLSFVIFLSWNKAITWWPFAMISTEIVCFIILLTLLKKENKSFSSIQLMPFQSYLNLGKITDFLNKKHSNSRFMSFSLDILFFVALLLILGFPAITLNGFLGDSISVLRDTKTIGVLPIWAIFLMIGLLPLTQAFIEFPWFYGYIYPRLEMYFEKESKNRRNVATLKALLIVVAFFILQAALIPLVLNLEYILWKAISFIPLFLIIGFVIRLVPRFMPLVNFLHALIALSVVLEYWKIK